ncbi:MAG: type II secretion system F family protein [Actinobacteria bacterium]|nr:type II secretion system F family protein [Actinomycetota bacterium]MCL6105145.1 type II secretion system F family protein [Actinomycetota bacterium]
MALTFEYKVRDRSGKLVEGVVEGDSIPLVATKLREMGYVPIAIQSKTMGMSTEIKIPFFSERVKLKEVAVAARQLATMIESGLPIVRSLAVLADQVENKQLSIVLTKVRLDVEAGSTLFAAMGKYPKVFNALFCTMVEAGEVSGTLDAVLSQVANTMEEQADLRAKVKSAMTYPVIVLCIIGLIFLALLIFIVPIFQKLFASLGGAKLPLPTRIVVGISHAILSPMLLVIIIVVVGIILLFRWWRSTESGRLKWDTTKLKFPIFGSLLHKVALTRFAGTLSSLLSSGVSILESLDMAGQASNNKLVEGVCQQAKEFVKGGGALATVLGENPAIIPMLVTNMVEVGEQTGALDAMLQKVSDFYSAEVNNTVNSLTSVLEPVLIVIMGVVVGTVIVAMYLPMFDYIKHVPTS